ncbi:hypothetical protein NX059_003579 [Plenodomus lindquistii]|nr:hypothetical protein NX059_003579 [Plenodomus lindquistii]
MTRIELGSTLLTTEYRSWWIPVNIDEELETVHRFPNLKSLHLHVQVSGPGWGPRKSDEADAMVCIVQKMLALHKEAPGIVFTASYSLLYATGFMCKRKQINYDPRRASEMHVPEQITVLRA